jgi:hypothetical protein
MDEKCEKLQGFEKKGGILVIRGNPCKNFVEDSVDNNVGESQFEYFVVHGVDQIDVWWGWKFDCGENIVQVVPVSEKSNYLLQFDFLVLLHCGYNASLNWRERLEGRNTVHG